MGCSNSKEPSRGTAAEQEANRAIEEQLAADEREAARHVKLLLLGAGESGKSTIAKQMKVIHEDGFDAAECARYTQTVHANVLSAMRALIDGCSVLGDVTIGAVAEANRVMAGGAGASAALVGDEGAFDLTPELGADIEVLWADAGIQEAYRRRSELQVIDSAEYYFTNVSRIAAEGYVPSQEDVLRSRAKTTGIIETQFQVGKTTFSLIDVGGQRSERRKWMHSFADVTAMLFCVALSGYDLVLSEDPTTNRMHEALKLFHDVCNTAWFANTAIILFLNKKDLFEAKIKSVPLTVCFKEYSGTQSYDDATAYIEDQFKQQNENPSKPIYIHHTCATDTNNITVVFGAVRDIILEQTTAHAAPV